MTEREKIIETLKQTSDLWKDEEYHGYIASVDIGEIADALIAANIGDVKETKFEADSYWRMWQGALVELERAEHRAEVAEKDLERHKRALRNAVWGLITEGVYGGDAETEQGLQSEIQNEIERAEREIEEEKGE